MTRSDPAAPWPQFALSISIGDIRLQVPDDDQLVLLADLAARPGGVLPPGSEHFVSWLAGREPSLIRQQLTARIRHNRDLTVRPGWSLDLAVLVDDVPVGMQTVAGFDRWPRRRIVGTSAWLATPWQGRGIGTLARAAALDLAITHLDADAAMSWAVPANRASIAVSERLGYRLTGAADPDDRSAEASYRLDGDSWRRARPARLPAARIEHARTVVALLAV